MKIKIFTFISISIFAAAAIAQSVVVTGKTITYKRQKPIADHKKTFTVKYPKIRARTPALSKKIESSISYFKVLDLNIKEELTDIQWLEEATFDIVHNENGLLVVDLSMYGTGAYPSGTTKTVVVDIRTGRTVRPTDVFTNLDQLVTKVRDAQKAEIYSSILEIRNDPEQEETDLESLFESSLFNRSDLDGFSVNSTGVTFLYDYGFPHVIQALQPAGKYFFSWNAIKPYIKRGGLLSRIAR